MSAPRYLVPEQGSQALSSVPDFHDLELRHLYRRGRGCSKQTVDIGGTLRRRKQPRSERQGSQVRPLPGGLTSIEEVAGVRDKRR